MPANSKNIIDFSLLNVSDASDWPELIRDEFHEITSGDFTYLYIAVEVCNDLNKFDILHDIYKIVSTYISDVTDIPDNNIDGLEKAAKIDQIIQGLIRRLNITDSEVHRLKNEVKELQEQNSQLSAELDQVRNQTREEAITTFPELDDMAIVKKLAGNVPLYVDRPVVPQLGRKQNALEFLREHYGTYLTDKVLYQDQLDKIDRQLLQGVKNYCKPRKLLVSEVIPPKRVRFDQILQKQGISQLDYRTAGVVTARRYREKSSLK